MVWEKTSAGEEFVLPAYICNLCSGFLQTDFMIFLQGSGNQGQNKRTNRLSHKNRLCYF